MKELFNLLGQVTNPTPNSGFASMNETLEKVIEVVNIALAIFYGIIGTLLIFACIYMGWRLAKAEDESQRKQAKSQMLYSIIGVIGVGMLIVVIIFVLPRQATLINGGAYAKFKVLDATVDAVNNLLSVIMQIVIALVGVFGCYVAWQFFKAEDESKRKQAKTQLIYCFIAVIGMALLATVANTVFSLASG